MKRFGLENLLTIFFFQSSIFETMGFDDVVQISNIYKRHVF